jgi:hypothetical protein
MSKDKDVQAALAKRPQACMFSVSKQLACKLHSITERPQSVSTSFSNTRFINIAWQLI